MKASILSFLRRLRREERGQVIPLAAIALLGLIGMGGLTMDVGSLYSVRSQVQNAVNSAALAASGSVWNSGSTSASTVATNFLQSYYMSTYGVDFSVSGSHAVPSMGTVSQPTVTLKCLNMLLASGSTCTSSTAKNAIVVSQTATAPTFFMNIFGVHSVPVTATATASMLGAAQPWNVAIVLDATGSMDNSDTNCKLNGVTLTELQCAINGIKTMLQAINPCSSGSSACTNDASLFRVALFIFPGFSGASASNLYTSCKDPSWQIYTLPGKSDTSYTALKYTYGSSSSFTGTYSVLYGYATDSSTDVDKYGFTSGYYSAGALSSTNPLIKTLGCLTSAASNGSLPGLQSGSQTYYASAIYAAQGALKAEQALHAGSKNALIFLSDGQANLPYSSSKGNLPSSTKFTVSSANSTALVYTASSDNGYYPSYDNQCQQGIIAAQDATQAGTRVYSVAYGSQQSGCGYYSGGTDVDTLTLPRTPNASFSGPSLTPCVTMENIASSLTYFYSDYLKAGVDSGGTCVDNSHSVTSLSDIFLSIAGSFTYPRLLPNNAAGI